MEIFCRSGRVEFDPCYGNKADYLEFSWHSERTFDDSRHVFFEKSESIAA